MKWLKLWVWMWVMFVVLGPVLVFAQEVASASPDPAPAGPLAFLVAIVVPAVVGFVKWIVPKIPSWVIPIAATLLGGLGTYLIGLATGSGFNPWLAGAIGLAGIGVREIVDQLKKITAAPASEY